MRNRPRNRGEIFMRYLVYVFGVCVLIFIITMSCVSKAEAKISPHGDRAIPAPGFKAPPMFFMVSGFVFRCVSTSSPANVYLCAWHSLDNSNLPE